MQDHLHGVCWLSILNHLCNSWGPWISGENPDKLGATWMWVLRGDERSRGCYLHGLTILDTWSGLRNLSWEYECGDWIDSGWRILIAISVPEFYPCIQQVFHLGWTLYPGEGIFAMVLEEILGWPPQVFSWWPDADAWGLSVCSGEVQRGLHG